jgi:hypothetical protein
LKTHLASEFILGTARRAPTMHIPRIVGAQRAVPIKIYQQSHGFGEILRNFIFCGKILQKINFCSIFDQN